MTEHDAGGHVLCVHSVVTLQTHQRMGIASWMLTEYLQSVLVAHPEVTRVALLAKQHNTGLYMRCGFTSHGASPVEHGEDTWHDLQLHVRGEDRALRQYTVDAFARKAFEGNPAAVVILPGRGCLPEAVNAADSRTGYMQKLAIENNLSETAFVQRCAAKPWQWALRWFTPGTEVTLCGHATLASAAAMWANKVVPRDQTRIQFVTALGPVSVSRSSDLITLDFPAEPVSACSPETTQEWVQHVKAATGQDGFVALGCYFGNMDGIVHVEPAVFDALPPAAAVDFSAIAKIPKRGVIVTAQGTGDVQFRSRFWGPNAGVNEDPVTGSAHCLLAPLWEQQLHMHGQSLHAFQSSTRGGHLTVQHVSATGRVLISGAATQTQTTRLSEEIGAQLTS